MTKIFSTAVILALAAILVLGALWIIDHPVALAVGITAVVSGVLFLICVGVWAASSWWTRKTMKAGAELVTQAQSFNDQWDARKTQSFAQLAKTMYAQSGRAQASADTPMLPLSNSSLLPEPRQFGQPDEKWEDVEVDANGHPKWDFES